MEYKRYLTKFDDWHKKQYGNEAITSDKVSEWIEVTYTNEQKSSIQAVAALKFRFNKCEKLNFSFKDLSKSSGRKAPHKVISDELMQHILETLKDD